MSITEKYFDVHCHIHDAPEKLCALKDLTTQRLALMGTRPEDWSVVACQAQAHPDRVCSAFGIHPWYAHLYAFSTASEGKEGLGWEKELRAYLEDHPKAIVGEIGMDKVAKDPETGQVYAMSPQLALLHTQLDLAVEYDRPISLHCVRASEELMRLLRDRGPSRLPPRIMLHSFSLSSETLRALLKLPCGPRLYWSISCVVSLRSPKAARWIEMVPRDRLLLESDLHSTDGVDDAMHRVVEQVAEIRGWSTQETMNIAWENSQLFFTVGSEVEG
ncbi:hypothetical protein BJ684DRAFT_19312 [Piptocephalis cylindrospora]|uniref:TatD family n=1 Tax=Piptocephalis cylindrospora TaxID=1907219 RepID=A0A4V1IYE3_9FUNG|nr:hypothetical protein BJ684DRAFT_19312 [Piptocephalis cylindrospora]|eukprot:RKP14259.1 hypothetical protein BJ684DRAFT_19312 [Piptocephalis cylindrospora]